MSRTVDLETMVPITIDEGVQLETLAFGEVADKFPKALKEVVANIADFGCAGATKREITIKVTLTPSDDRSHAEVEVGITTKLAPKRPAKTKLYFSPAGNELAISEENPDQPRLGFK